MTYYPQFIHCFANRNICTLTTLSFQAIFLSHLTFRAVLRPKEPQPKRGGIETRKLKEGDDAGRDDGDSDGDD